jgi:hypothetical protein
MPLSRRRWIEKNAYWQTVQTWESRVAAVLAAQAIERERGLPCEAMLLAFKTGAERFAIITRHHPERSGAGMIGGEA